MTERRSDGVSGNGGNGGNIGGRFGRDGMRFGFNGKGMEWNMVHDRLKTCQSRAPAALNPFSFPT